MMAAEGVDPHDWATIWQSELAALAVDRECQEGFLAWGQAWAGAGDATAGRTSPDAAPRAAPAGLAPDAEPVAEYVRQFLAGMRA